MTMTDGSRAHLQRLTTEHIQRRGRAETESRELRDAMGQFASGVTVVTGFDADGPVGFTCQSFHSVSLEPALISFSVMTSSTSYFRLREAGRFCINVLANGQDALSNQFARRGTDKWAGVSWGVSTAGNPVLDGTMMWIDCVLRDEHDAGDHVIVVAEISELSPIDWFEGEPLVFFRGSYRSLQRQERWPRRSWICDV